MLMSRLRVLCVTVVTGEGGPAGKLRSPQPTGC